MDVVKCGVSCWGEIPKETLAKIEARDQEPDQLTSMKDMVERSMRFFVT